MAKIPWRSVAAVAVVGSFVHVIRSTLGTEFPNGFYFIGFRCALALMTIGVLHVNLQNLPPKKAIFAEISAVMFAVAISTFPITLVLLGMKEAPFATSCWAWAGAAFAGAAITMFLSLLLSEETELRKTVHSWQTSWTPWVFRIGGLIYLTLSIVLVAVAGLRSPEVIYGLAAGSSILGLLLLYAFPRQFEEWATGFWKVV